MCSVLSIVHATESHYRSDSVPLTMQQEGSRYAVMFLICNASVRRHIFVAYMEKRSIQQ